MFPGRGRGMMRPTAPVNMQVNMNLSRISNVTNSNDPHLMKCRVFVGNLNTFQVKKEDVENVFKKYGRITGISMHKGFAFVQFMNQRHARLAVAGEDQNVFAGQKLDVNISTEPKNKQIVRKRPAGMEGDSGGFNSAPRMGPPMKRMRPEMNQSMKRTLVPLSGPNMVNNKPVVQSSPKTLPSTASLQTYDSPDILICGNCKSLFSDLDMLITHRKKQCRLRFMCKCNATETSQKKSDEPASFICATCKSEFSCSWELVKHCQHAHNMAIYSNPNEQSTESSEAESRSQDVVTENTESDDTAVTAAEEEQEEKEKSNGQEEELALEDEDEACVDEDEANDDDDGDEPVDDALLDD